MERHRSGQGDGGRHGHVPAPPDAPPEGDPALWTAAEEVGDRWTLLIAAALLAGPRRFGDLQRALPGIAPNVLTQRLRRMVALGLVASEPYTRRPPRLVYELTGAGRELEGPLRMLGAWGARRAGGEGPRHALCGTPLEARLWCPVCERPVDDGDDPEELQHL